MQKLAFAAAAACSVLALGACTSEEVDELMPTSEEEGVDAKADGDGGTFTYFEISRDLRKCASPMCGGFFLDRLNHSTTRCVDGKLAASCYAPELDMSESKLSAGAFDKLVEAADKSTFGEGVHAIVRGRFAKGNSSPRPELGRFVVTEVWVSQSDAVSEGVFAKVMDNGIRCITAPCPSLVEKGLNTSRTANITDVDFSESGVSDSVLAEVGNDMFSDHGVIVAGYRYTVAKHAKGRTATAVYRRLLETNDGACFVGGCSGQVCSDQEGVITTCEARPEFACYHDATCERQADGNCGWTPTAELNACLGN